MPRLVIECVSIPRYPGFSRPRWFVDLKCDDGSTSNVGSADSEKEARELLRRVEIVGQRWTLRNSE